MHGDGDFLLFVQGQFHDELAAATRAFTARADRPVMKGDELAREREPDSAPGWNIRCTLFALLEPVEDALQRLRLDSETVVPHAQDGATLRAFGRDLDPAAAGRV